MAERPPSGAITHSGHHCPRIMSTGRHGCWAECRCGWISRDMTTRIGASVAWAEHVAARHTRSSGKAGSDRD